MGMFDRIHCEYPLPDSDAQNLEFQTKDLDCSLTDYDITKEGRLVEHHWDYEATPEDELPYKDSENELMRFVGSIRRVEGSHRVVDTNYHGMLRFYGSIHTGDLFMIDSKTGKDTAHPGPEPEWFEYEAKFTDGTVVSITRIKNDG